MNKYHNKKIVIDGIEFDSKRERIQIQRTQIIRTCRTNKRHTITGKIRVTA